MKRRFVVIAAFAAFFIGIGGTARAGLSFGDCMGVAGMAYENAKNSCANAGGYETQCGMAAGQVGAGAFDRCGRILLRK